MTPAQFIELIESPAKLDGTTLPLLNEITKTFPYCQSAQILYAVNLHRQNSIHFPVQLKKAALYAYDRSVLYRAIYQPSVKSAISRTEERGDDIPMTKQPPEQTSPLPESSLPDKPSITMDVSVPKDVEKPALVENVPADLSLLEASILREAISAAITTDIQKEYEEVMGEPTSVTTVANITRATALSSGPAETEFRTFSDWLKSMPLRQQEVEEKPPAGPASLTEKFISDNPRFAPRQEFFSPINIARLSIIDNESFVSETLAKIYASQGNTEKAIRIYEILMKEEPEKRDYYLKCIEKVKE